MRKCLHKAIAAKNVKLKKKKCSKKMDVPLWCLGTETIPFPQTDIPVRGYNFHLSCAFRGKLVSYLQVIREWSPRSRSTPVDRSTWAGSVRYDCMPCWPGTGWQGAEAASLPSALPASCELGSLAHEERWPCSSLPSSWQLCLLPAETLGVLWWNSSE